MKLVSYAHCNSSLRDLYRRRLLHPILRQPTAVAAATIVASDSIDGQPDSQQTGQDGQRSQRSSQNGQLSPLLRPSSSVHVFSGRPNLTVDTSFQGRSPSATAWPSPAGVVASSPVPPGLAQSFSHPHLSTSNDQAAAAAVSARGVVIYPQNLTLQNLAYFMVAPTLVYQLNYPRREAIRWSKLGKWAVALVLGAALYAFIIDQYFIPSMVSGMRPFSEMNYMAVTGGGKGGG